MLNSDVCAQYLPRVLRNLVNDDSHDVRIRILPSLRSVLERMHFLDDTEKLITVQPIVDGTNFLFLNKTVFKAQDSVQRLRSPDAIGDFSMHGFSPLQSLPKRCSVLQKLPSGY